MAQPITDLERQLIEKKAELTALRGIECALQKVIDKTHQEFEVLFKRHEFLKEK